MAKKKQKEPFGVIMLYKLGGSEKYHGIECTSDVFDDEDMAKEALAGEWFESPQEAAASAKAAEKKKAPAKSQPPRNQRLAIRPRSQSGRTTKTEHSRLTTPPRLKTKPSKVTRNKHDLEQARNYQRCL